MPLREKLWRNTVVQLDKRAAIVTAPTASIREAVTRMQTEGVGCLLIVEGDRLVGVFTERDLLKRVLGKKRNLQDPVSQVMTPGPAVARADEPIGLVIERMRDGGYRHLPMVDDRGHIAGRISVREIVHYMVEHFPKAVYNLPPRPDQVHAKPEGA